MYELAEANPTAKIEKKKETRRKNDSFFPIEPKNQENPNFQIADFRAISPNFYALRPESLKKKIHQSLNETTNHFTNRPTRLKPLSPNPSTKYAPEAHSETSKRTSEAPWAETDLTSRPKAL